MTWQQGMPAAPWPVLRGAQPVGSPSSASETTIRIPCPVLDPQYKADVEQLGQVHWEETKPSSCPEGRSYAEAAAGR